MGTEKIQMVSAKALQAAVSDLQITRPGPGLVKVAVCTAILAPSLYLAMTTESALTFCLSMTIASMIAAAFIITTHDGIHHTLTGWASADEIIPRLISWPLNWCHGVYSEVHKLHHKMNGDDVNDPERVQWTQEEYAVASRPVRFYIRHQWFFDIFVFAAFGLIYQTFRAGFHYAGRSKTMRRALYTDIAGIVASNALIYGLAIAYGRGWRWLLVWFLLERVTGAVLQWRAHIEHYGLWGKGRHYFETQNYNCRNLRTSELASWFFNRLNFHSVHHAFPRVPFYALETAHRRFMALYADSPEPLVEETGYFATSFRLARNPTLIGAVDAASPSQRRAMVSAAELDRMLV